MKKDIPILTARKLPVPYVPCVLNELRLEEMLFKNISFAWKMDVKPKTDPAWLEVLRQLSQYNAYLQVLRDTPGFEKFFSENGYCLSKQQLVDRFGEDFTEKVFALDEYPFRTDIEIRDGHFLNGEMQPRFRVAVPGFGRTHFTTDEPYITLSDPANHSTLLWNWSADYRDFTYCLLGELDELKLLPEETEHSAKSYANYFCYEQHRNNMTAPDHNLLRCMEVLETTGYLTLYKIRPSTDSPWFSYRENAYGMVAVLDWEYRKDALLKENLRLVLAQPEEEVDVCRYFLTDSNGKQYLSDRPGKLGGHRELKIYGKLDCSSANRHIANGKYIRHRVFFADEATAIAAGYRPCSVCMQEQYQKWKSQKL